MRRIAHPRRPTHALVAALTAVGALTLPTAVSAPGDRVASRVALTSDGSVVSDAAVPLERGRTTIPTTGFSQVAATWRGPEPRVRVRVPGGRWQRLHALEDVADPATEGAAGVRGSDLLWTGRRTSLEVRLRPAGARDVELVLIDPGSLPSDSAAGPAAASRAVPDAAARRNRPDAAPRPDLRSRKRWGADPSWRNGRPRYLDRLKQVHLHHTATSNRYRRADVPAIIRGMYRYHTQSLGWFDIGYNFLVDKFGRTWVGRSGGANRLVQGAHTLGFNHASVGVAVIGNHEQRKPRREAIRALVRVAAWKLDAHDRRAKGKVWVTSTGSDQYAEGERARLPAFDGHRDTNHTACPGERLYDRLPALRRKTQQRIERFS